MFRNPRFLNVLTTVMFLVGVTFLLFSVIPYFNNVEPSSVDTENTIEEENTNETLDNNVVEESLMDNNPIDPHVNEEKYILTEEEYDGYVQELQSLSHIMMDTYLYNLYYEEISKDLNKYIGKTVQLSGFVYKEEGFSDNQLVISRFLVTHSPDDADIVGFLSEFNEASTLSEDTWIEATGTLEKTNYNGSELPQLKITSWKKIDEPDESYVYPITIKMQ